MARKMSAFGAADLRIAAASSVSNRGARQSCQFGWPGRILLRMNSGSFVVADVVHSDGDHKTVVLELSRNASTDGELPLHARSADVVGKYDDLLDGLMPQDEFDIVPEVVSSKEFPHVDPHPVAGKRQLCREPEREFVVLGRGMANEDRLARLGGVS